MEEGNIWDELKDESGIMEVDGPESVPHGEGKIRAASFNRMVLMLTDEHLVGASPSPVCTIISARPTLALTYSVDPNFLKMFLMTYHSFTTPERLFTKLRER